MTGRGYGGLDAAAKAKLLAELEVRADARAEPDVASMRPAVANERPLAFDFSDLPAFKQLRMQRAAADVIGLRVPFFQVHEARAGSSTRIAGQDLLNFSSYDYLGLNGHPEIAAAARRAIDRYGTSVSASRVVAGERPIHRELERAIADLHGVDDAVVFVSGHATNVTVVGHLLGPGDLVLMDALSHNSIAEGAKLSRATRLLFPHDDLDALEAMLVEHRRKHGRCLIVVEGLYSMDGDAPDLARLVALKRRFDAWLMVDEAHSIGVLGGTGRGLAEETGVDPRSVEIWMGTLSKAFVGCGGYIAGSKPLIEYLKATAPGFVYSVGLAPALAAASLAAIGLLRREPERPGRLRENGRLFLAEARRVGLSTGTSLGASVIPIVLGDSVRAVQVSNALFDAGVNALPIIFPAVAERQARLRFFITTAHEPHQIRAAVTATAAAVEEAQSGPTPWSRAARG